MTWKETDGREERKCFSSREEEEEERQVEKEKGKRKIV